MIEEDAAALADLKAVAVRPVVSGGDDRGFVAPDHLEKYRFLSGVEIVDRQHDRLAGRRFGGPPRRQFYFIG